MALEISAAVLCCCFRDDKALGESSDAIQDQERAAASASAPRRDDAGRPKPRKPRTPRTTPRAPPDDRRGRARDAVDPRIKMIPYAVFCTDLVVALGSGCGQIKFFPLWFKNDLRMSPAAVQGIYRGVPLSMALASGFCTALSRRIGRVESGPVRPDGGTLICFAGMLRRFLTG